MTDPTTKQRISFTAGTKPEAELIAAEYLNGMVRYPILLPRLQKKRTHCPEFGTDGYNIEGASIELAVTLALTLGLRQSEIAGLKWSDYDGTHLYIHSTIVPNDGKGA